VLRVLIAEDDRVALAPYHKPDLAVLDLWLADGDLGHIQQGVQVRDYVGTPEGESANLGLKIEGSWPEAGATDHEPTLEHDTCIEAV
jgi:hypothetical protein